MSGWPNFPSVPNSLPQTPPSSQYNPTDPNSFLVGYTDTNFSSGYPPSSLDPDAFKAQYSAPSYPVPSPFPETNYSQGYPSTNYTTSPSPYNQYSTQPYSPQPNYSTNTQYSTTNQYGTTSTTPYPSSYSTPSQQYATNQQYDYGANQQYSTNQQYTTNQQYSTSQPQQYGTTQQYGTNQQYATTQAGYSTSGPVSSSLSPYSTPTEPQHPQYPNTATYSLPSTPVGKDAAPYSQPSTAFPTLPTTHPAAQPVAHPTSQPIPNAHTQQPSAPTFQHPASQPVPAAAPQQYSQPTSQSIPAPHAAEAQQKAPESAIEEVEGWLWQQNTNGAWLQLYFILDPDGILLGFDRYPEEGSSVAPKQGLYLKPGMTVTSPFKAYKPLVGEAFSIQAEPGSTSLVIFDTIHAKDRERWVKALKAATKEEMVQAWQPWECKTSEVLIAKQQELELKRKEEEEALLREQEKQIEEQVKNSNPHLNVQLDPSPHDAQADVSNDFAKQEEERIRAELAAKFEKELEERRKKQEEEWEQEKKKLKNQLLNEQKQQILGWLHENPQWKEYYLSLGIKEEELTDPVFVRKLILQTSNFVINGSTPTSSPQVSQTMELPQFQPPQPSYPPANQPQPVENVPPPRPTEAAPALPPQYQQPQHHEAVPVPVEDVPPPRPSVPAPGLPLETVEVPSPPTMPPPDIPAPPNVPPPPPPPPNVPPPPVPTATSGAILSQGPPPPPPPNVPPPPSAPPMPTALSIASGASALKHVTPTEHKPLQHQESMLDQIQAFKFSGKKAVTTPKELPKQSRDDLAELLSNQLERFRGKLGEDTEPGDDADDDWD